MLAWFSVDVTPLSFSWFVLVGLALIHLAPQVQSDPDDWILTIQGLTNIPCFAQFVGHIIRGLHIHFEDCHTKLGFKVCTGQSTDFPDPYFVHTLYKWCVCCTRPTTTLVAISATRKKIGPSLGSQNVSQDPREGPFIFFFMRLTVIHSSVGCGTKPIATPFIENRKGCICGYRKTMLFLMMITVFEVLPYFNGVCSSLLDSWGKVLHMFANRKRMWLLANWILSRLCLWLK